MELADVVQWAWARHHNLLSWYIRPLFLLPFCYFAYQRSLVGIVGTLLALTTSMFWFPAPTTVSPGVQAMLDAERAYLLGEWTIIKLALALLVPLTLTALALAFWARSFLWGFVVLNIMVVSKIAWTFAYAPAEGAFAHLIPALLGLGVCNGMVLLARRWIRSS